jgi:hypothetical protein
MCNMCNMRIAAFTTFRYRGMKMQAKNSPGETPPPSYACGTRHPQLVEPDVWQLGNRLAPVLRRGRTTEAASGGHPQETAWEVLVEMRDVRCATGHAAAPASAGLTTSVMACTRHDSIRDRTSAGMTENLTGCVFINAASLLSVLVHTADVSLESCLSRQFHPFFQLFNQLPVNLH